MGEVLDSGGINARTKKASAPSGLKYRHVDVFSSKPLSGNGVTVFRLRKALPATVMQQITREMRQFESIFVLQKARSQTIRAWVFTMEEELDFAGHPVLGAAVEKPRIDYRSEETDNARVLRTE
jgi:PhzF family phenazine biosynthesis protein